MYTFDGKYLLRRKINHIQETLRKIEYYRQWALPPHPVNIKGATSYYKARNCSVPNKLKNEDFKVVRNKVFLNKIRAYCDNLKQRSARRHHNIQKFKKGQISRYNAKRITGPIKPLVIHQHSLMKSKAILMKNRWKYMKENRPLTGISNQNSKSLKGKDEICEKRPSTTKTDCLNRNTEKCVKNVDSDKTLTGSNNGSATKLKQALKSNNYRTSGTKRTLNGIVKKKREIKMVYRNKVRNLKPRIQQKRMKGGAESENFTCNTPHDEPSAIKIQPTFKVPRLKTDYSSIMDCYRVRSKEPFMSQNVEEIDTKPVPDVIKNMLTLRTSQLQINCMDTIRHNHNMNTGYPYSSEKLKRQNYYAEDIRLAVLTGGSRDPSKNEILNRVLAKALNDNVSWSLIDQTLNNCKRPKAGNKRIEILQIELCAKIYIICTVYTNDLVELVNALENVMKRYSARFAPVVNHFTHCCVIEAIAPYHGENAHDLENYLKKVSKSLGMNSIDIVNYDTLEVCVKSKPEDMGRVADTLTRKGYKILDLDFGFRPKELINLSGRELHHYHHFITYLQETTNFETITDNVM